MPRRPKLWVAVLVVAFLLSPLAERADAGSIGREWLSVNASDVFRVTGTIYWDHVSDPTSSGWQIELEWHGMDSGHSDILRRDTFNIVRGSSLQQTFAYSVANAGRWANEDRDRWFSRRRDEIRCIVKLRHRGTTYWQELTNQVTGYF